MQLHRRLTGLHVDGSSARYVIYQPPPVTYLQEYLLSPRYVSTYSYVYQCLPFLISVECGITSDETVQRKGICEECECAGEYTTCSG